MPGYPARSDRTGKVLRPRATTSRRCSSPTSTPAPTRPAVKPTATFRISERATPRRSSEFQIRCHRIDAGACTGIVDVAARRARDADAADDAALRLDRPAAAQPQRFGAEVGAIGLAARLGGFAEGQVVGADADGGPGIAPRGLGRVENGRAAC